ncbi:hypothetical protein GMRT_15114 [Giardia muris]|uniref:DUF8206 domain-containing protein n=1 Tax=Giardia muris TaxID=5742 RepID=A0A4Z1T617_GIAMU|nr:hypothetical protein GMRT_15114 [Giardia muris]|eukprot:TNJ27969.1 hypothetical protein GMRT_15114 [Giardia muris]
MSQPRECSSDDSLSSNTDLGSEPSVDSISDDVRPPENRPTVRNRANVLLLGETGVGKSTFVNGFINYLRFNSLPSTQEELDNIQWAVPMKFSITDKNYKSVGVRVGPQDVNEQNGNVGGSSTQDPKVHVFDARGIEVHLIDTPGIGDTRGYECDRRNFDQIIEFIKDYELHGICMLLKPNNARLNVFFRFCIEELLVHLPVSAKKNIVFCFTNARSTFYRPGDTLEPLKKLLIDRKIGLGLNKDTMYCFDNEAMRFLAARVNGVVFSKGDTRSFRESWERASKELERLINHLKLIPPQSGADIKRLDEIRQTIIGLAVPMADAMQIIQRNIELQKRHGKDLRKLTGEEDDLRSRLKIEVIKYSMKEYDQPRTVCVSCSSQVEVNGIRSVQFDRACHDPCYLKTVMPMVVGHPDLRNCAAMNGTEMCTVCSHSWTEHMHTMHKAYPEKVVEDNPEVEASLANAADRKKVIDDEIKKAKKQSDEYNREYRRIIEISARFAQYVRRNALLEFNSSLGEYLKVQIKKLEDLGSNATDSEKKSLEGYRKSLNQYEQEVRVFEAAVSGGTASVPTAEEADRLIKELENLPLMGESFRRNIEANRRMVSHYEQHLRGSNTPSSRKARRRHR